MEKIKYDPEKSTENLLLYSFYERIVYCLHLHYEYFIQITAMKHLRICILHKLYIQHGFTPKF